MDVTTTACDQKTARRKLQLMNEARNKLGDKFSEDDRLLLKAYRELAAGRRLIDVNKAIIEGGLNLAGFPKLAIARADRRQVFWVRHRDYRWVNEQSVWYNTGGGRFEYGNRNRRRDTDVHVWALPPESLPAGSLKETSKSGMNLCAMVPYIPAHLRPTRGIGSYFILFEANWFWSKESPISSPDPFLLKPIQGSLMAIYAAWDLTGLEQQIFDAAAFAR